MAAYGAAMAIAGLIARLHAADDVRRYPDPQEPEQGEPA